MAVLDYYMTADGSKGPMYGADGTRTYKQKWHATTDTEETWQTIANAIGIVQFQTAHYSDPFALAIDADFEQDEDDDNHWIVNYTFSTKLNELAQISLAGGGGGAPTQGSGHDPEEPLTWAPKVRWSTKMFKRVRIRDNDGKLYANAAGEVLEASMKEFPRLVLNVQRNIVDFDVSLLLRLPGSVNGEECIGYEWRRIKCERLTAEPKYDKQRYWSVEGEFIIASPSDVSTVIWPGIPAFGWWYDKRLNAGYQEIRNGTRRPIFQNGQKPTRPVPLTQTGRVCTDFDPPVDPNFLYFRELDDADFNGTGLFDP